MVFKCVDLGFSKTYINCRLKTSSALIQFEATCLKALLSKVLMRKGLPHELQKLQIAVFEL